MDNATDPETLLQEIASYCRTVGLAESTFGRLAINDGKLVNRLRYGGRVTTDTVDRIRGFMANGGRAQRPRTADMPPPAAAPVQAPQPAAEQPPAAVAPPPVDPAPDKNFRFYDNRQKYLLFVNTCSEKWVVAQRVAMELGNVHPRPPAVRLFDAGVGDGSVLSRVMRAMHHRFPTMPHYLVGKEISLEDVRLTLDKMPDRFFEHPATVLVMTNLNYSEAPWLAPNSVTAATSLVWRELALTGNTAHDFEQQIIDQQAFLADHWRARSGKAGNPVYERPVVLVVYREDQKFLLDSVIPRRGVARADYDLVIASQPYRARASAEFKAKRVLAPLARSLGPAGRMLAIHSHGNDPGLEIVQKVWPGENPFIHDRHELLKVAKAELGADGRDLNFNAYSDSRSLFRYDMHTLPSEVSQTIGTSTLFAAWNAAIYVAQIEDQRLAAVISDRGYLDATSEVLQKHGGLWFYDESFVISRRRD
jgi:hypothetical protein